MNRRGTDIQILLRANLVGKLALAIEGPGYKAELESLEGNLETKV